MGNRLSHSQVSKFQQCGKAYQFWYIDKIRPTKSRSALLFGSALDKAIGVLLNPNEDKTRTPEQVFDYYWEHQDINGERTYLPDNIALVYAKTDFDKDLLTLGDFDKFGISKDAVLELVEKRTEVGFDNLTQDEKLMANKIFWTSLSYKGHYMIKAFREKVLPKLTKIHSTQEYIELDNGDDKVIGYIDIVANVEGHEEPVILDLKTSASQYEDNSVLTSPQLSLYVHAVSDKYKTKKAGYIVLNKNIIKNKTKVCSKCSFDGTGGKHKTCSNEINNKRCNGEWKETFNPDVYVQFIIDNIPETTENLVLENIDDINVSIKTGHFTRNLTMCTNTYGGLCDYISLCYRGKMEGLCKKD
jgi:hypothetical protein